MASVFQPPPTWALPILVDEQTNKAIFNPIWLKWFVDLTASLTGTGGGAGTGDVRGPASAADNALALYDGTTGKLLKAAASTGTATTLLHGNAGGPPTFSKVSLTADVSGVLPSANMTWVVEKTSGYGIKVDTAVPTFPWHDMLGPIGVRTAGATDPVWTVYRGAIYAYTFDTATAECFLVFHLSHDWLPSQANMYVHMHWSQNVVDTGGTAGVPGVVEWNFDITYADGYGTAGGAGDPFIAPVTFTITQQGSTTQYGHMIAEVEFANNGGTGGKLDTATMQVDGLILVRAYRIKANAADTLNQAPFGHTCDIHYQSTNVGTKQKNGPNFYT